MRVNMDHMVISVFICVAMISQGVIWSGCAKEKEPVERLIEPTYEELAAKVDAQEKRIVRLELIIDMFKGWGTELNDPMFEIDIDTAVDEIVGAQPKKQNILGSVILIGALILLVIGIAALTIRLSRR